MTRLPVSCQLHGQAEVDDDTRAVSLDENIPAVQVPVGNRWLVQVLMEENERGKQEWQREDQENTQANLSFIKTLNLYITPKIL